MTVISNLLARIDWTSAPVFTPDADRIIFATYYALAVWFWLRWLHIGRRPMVRQAFGAVVTFPMMLGAVAVVVPWVQITVMAQDRGGTVPSSKLVFTVGPVLAGWAIVQTLCVLRLKAEIRKGQT